jgi:hypothetical protein
MKRCNIIVHKEKMRHEHRQKDCRMQNKVVLIITIDEEPNNNLRETEGQASGGKPSRGENERTLSYIEGKATHQSEYKEVRSCKSSRITRR